MRRAALLELLNAKPASPTLGGGSLPEDIPASAYSVRPHYLPSSLAAKFVQLGPAADGETSDWLQACSQRRSRMRTALVRFLRNFMGHTNANAYLGHGRMFVLSSQQTKQFAKSALSEEVCEKYCGISVSDVEKSDRSSALFSGDLLDIGTGNGDVTERFARVLVSGTTFCCEESELMIPILKDKGFSVITQTELEDIRKKDVESGRKFKVISLFNVLDRCSHPISLLRSSYELLDESGVLLIAIVFPLCPWVEQGADWVKPVEKFNPRLLRLNQAEPQIDWFERSVELFESEVLNPNGFEVVRFSRVPYFSDTDNIFGPDWVFLPNAILWCIKKPVSESTIPPVSSSTEEKAS